MSNELTAIDNLRKINVAEKAYVAGAGHGQFGDLNQLASEHLIEARLASGEAGGYEFTCTPLNVQGKPPMFDATAKPMSTGVLGNGNRSFGSNETMHIYETVGAAVVKGTTMDRRPQIGVPIK